MAAGDGFTFVLTASGSVYGCGSFKDDQGGTSGFSATVKVQTTFTLVYQGEDKVRGQVWTKCGQGVGGLGTRHGRHAAIQLQSVCKRGRERTS